MLGNTLTLVDGDYPLINEGGYSSEYRLKDGTTIKSLRVRHSKEKPQKDGVLMDRHNVELTYTFPPSADYPNGYSTQVYIIARFPPATSTSSVADQSAALGQLLHSADFSDLTFLTKVLNWES